MSEQACLCVGCLPVGQAAAAGATRPLRLPDGGLGAGGLLLRQGTPPPPQEAVAGVDRHAGVFDQQVLQRAAGHRLLLAAAREAGRGSDQPALHQGGGIQMEESSLVLLILTPLLLRGLEGGAGGVAQQGAGRARGRGPGDHHEVVVIAFLVLVLRHHGRAGGGVAWLVGAFLG